MSHEVIVNNLLTFTFNKTLNKTFYFIKIEHFQSIFNIIQ